MRVYVLLQAVMAGLAMALLCSCSFKIEGGYHGQTGRDDRVISPTLYPEGISQSREAKQRY